MHCKILYRFLIIFLSFCLSVTVKSQTEPAEDTTAVVSQPDEESTTTNEVVEKDPYVFTIRPISQDTMAGIKADKDYAYMQYLDSLLRNRKQEATHRKRNGKGSGSDEENDERTISVDTGAGGSGFLSMVLWILAIGALLYIVYTIFLGEGSMFKTNKKNVEARFEAEEESETGDVLSKKAKALQNGNYRLATRYAYLELLELLASKKLIEIRTDKTNYQYMNELMRQPWVNAFASVTLKYEYIWYGEYNIDKQLYSRVEEEFNNLKKQVK